MRVQKYLKLAKDVLLEWIYDDDNYIAENYVIAEDTIQRYRFFSQQKTTSSIPSTVGNTVNYQTFAINRDVNKWGVVNPDPVTNKYGYVQLQQFPGNVPVKYDIIRIHFPINYNFNGYLGFRLAVDVQNKTQDKRYGLCSYFYDKTNADRLLELKLGKPFHFQDKMWGKYIELSIPSPNVVSKDYQAVGFNALQAVQGGIHSNLIGDTAMNAMLDADSPVFISFAYLLKKDTTVGQQYFITTEPFTATIQAVPEYETLAVQIVHSDQGDYFEICGTFNGNLSDFSTFMRRTALEGKKFYIIYEINRYEKNIKTGFEQRIVTEDFDLPTEYRPIIKFSTTTALIEVIMKLVNTVDESIIQRTATYAMLQDEVGKYSSRLTKINTVGVVKPKLYSNPPQQVQLPTTLANRASNVQATVAQVAIPMLYERKNIIIKNKSEHVNDDVYYGSGQAMITLYPTDNILKFVVAQGIDQTKITPYQVPSNTQVLLIFKGDTQTLEIPLYAESKEVDITNGVLVFKIAETQVPQLRILLERGNNKFMLVLRGVTGITTLLYPGFFEVYK